MIAEKRNHVNLVHSPSLYLTLGVAKMYLMRKLYKLPQLKHKELVENMRTKYERALNPRNYYLSEVAKKRLQWMYIIEYESDGKIARVAKKIAISRQWLSAIHTLWIKTDKDPRSLEPQSRTPHHTGNRNRISYAIEDKIVALRKEYPAWGKEKLAVKLKSRYRITVCPTTVNNYLTKHKLLNVKLSEKNHTAFQNKILRQQQKVRPPKIIKDLKPGALIEKDMKYILKPGQIRAPGKEKAGEHFYYQHTEIDSFTRVRALELVTDAESETAATAHRRAVKRFPFPGVCVNTDSGGENGRDFAKLLANQKVIHFFSRTGTPTDNPRVERSHLTDELEFYQQGNIYPTFKAQQAALAKWERTYNYDRPHQALGQLSPMEFYALWKENPAKAYVIKDKYQQYLKRQQARLNASRRMKKKEQIEALMQHLDSVLTVNSYH